MKHIIFFISVLFLAVSCNVKKSDHNYILRAPDPIEILQQKVNERTIDLEIVSSRDDQITDKMLWEYGIFTSGMVINAVNHIKWFALYNTRSFEFLFNTISKQEEWISKGSELLQEDQKYNCFRQELQKISEIENFLPQPYLQYFNDLNIKYLQ